MNGASTTSRSEINGGQVKLGPSVFWHFRKSLRDSPNGEAIIVAHQQPDHLAELATSLTLPVESALSIRHSKAQSQGDTDPCLRWTYQQLHNAAVTLVAALHKNNVSSGSTIVHLFPNSIEWCIVLWASKLGKFTQSAFDVGLLTAPRRHELQQMIQMANPDVIVVANAESASAVEKVLEVSDADKLPKLKVVLSSEPNDQNHSTNQKLFGWTSLLQLALSASPVSAEIKESIEADGLHDDLSRVSDIMFTSGTTTGQPKGCPRRVAGSLHLIATQHWGPGCTGEQSKTFKIQNSTQNRTSQDVQPNRSYARIALAGQNFRIIAPSMVTSVWAAGGTIVIASAQPDFGALLSAIPRFKVRSILMIPPGVNAISAHADFASLDQSSLESVSLGGDIVTQAIFEKAAQLFPKCQIIVSHGMTEGGSAFYYPYIGRCGQQILADIRNGDDTSDRVIRFRSGIASLGKVNVGTRLKVADDHNKPVRRNEVGELHFDNPSIVRQYLRSAKPEDFYIEDSTDKQGNAIYNQWFKSGDLGIIDQDDWVWILGRKKDVIKRMGISVVPAALENSLNTFLNAETSIIPHLHPTLGQVPIAVVTAKSLTASKRSKTDVEKNILEHFGKDYALGGVVTIEEIGLSEFPLNATGKIVKRELVEVATPFLEANVKT